MTWAIANQLVIGTIAGLRYFAGWADKIHGKTIEVGGKYLDSRHFLILHDRPMRPNWLIRDMNRMALW